MKKRKKWKGQIGDFSIPRTLNPHLPRSVIVEAEADEKEEKVEETATRFSASRTPNLLLPLSTPMKSKRRKRGRSRRDSEQFCGLSDSQPVPTYTYTYRSQRGRRRGRRSGRDSEEISSLSGSQPIPITVEAEEDERRGRSRRDTAEVLGLADSQPITIPTPIPTYLPLYRTGEHASMSERAIGSNVGQSERGREGECPRGQPVRGSWPSRTN